MGKPTPTQEPRIETVASFVDGKHTYESVTENISSIVFRQRQHPVPWWVTFFIAFMLLNMMMLTLGYLVFKGVGIFGINQPVGWGFDIINFVWWIGIGHAGTLISAVLLLMRQQWRTSINRFAEAMTLFAVACAGLYPLFHTGRPWLAYWMFPYPSVLGTWPQFRSPLIWDVFAVSTYATVSVLFWYTGLIPDLATLRDRAKSRLAQVLTGIFALGWRGSAKHWFRYEWAYLVLAGLSTPLVLSVHSIVSLDFAVGIVPGWHTTIFPPYFVAGAIYAGFAMVLTLALPIRAWYNIKDLITETHIDWMAKVMLATGLMVCYGYILEMFYGMYSGNPYEIYLVKNRLVGPYAPLYYALWLCNGLIPQLMWFPRFRKNLIVVFIVANVVSVGMWLERFVIIPMSLHRDYLPSAWGMYNPSIFDVSLFLGSLGLFFFLMFLFIRFIPMISIFEVRDLLYRIRHNRHGGHAHDEHASDTAPEGAPGS